LRRPPLPVPDQGQHVPLPVAARLPVERVLEPPPDPAAGASHCYWLTLLRGAELPVSHHIDAHRRAAGTGEPATAAEQEPSVQDESRVRVLPQLHAGGRGGAPGERRRRGTAGGQQRQSGHDDKSDHDDRDQVAERSHRIPLPELRDSSPNSPVDDKSYLSTNRQSPFLVRSGALSRPWPFRGPAFRARFRYGRVVTMGR